MERCLEKYQQSFTKTGLHSDLARAIVAVVRTHLATLTPATPDPKSSVLLEAGRDVARSLDNLVRQLRGADEKVLEGVLAPGGPIRPLRIPPDWSEKSFLFQEGEFLVMRDELANECAALARRLDSRVERAPATTHQIGGTLFLIAGAAARADFEKAVVVYALQRARVSRTLAFRIAAAEFDTSPRVIRTQVGRAGHDAPWLTLARVGRALDPYVASAHEIIERDVRSAAPRVARGNVERT